MIEIIGDSVIKGEVEISGSKNASLPIICASLLTKGIVELKNVPLIDDVKVLLTILESLNVRVTWSEKKLIIDSRQIQNKALVNDDVKKIRGSSYLLSVLLALFKEVKMSYPGGCSLGKRTLNYHMDAFKLLGVNISEGDYIAASYTKLKGASIGFSDRSVGASINAIILAGASKQVVKIYNYASEPEVMHLCRFLRKIGYKIFEFKDYLLIAGHKHLKRKVSFQIPYDRIEGQSYLLLGLKAQELVVKNVAVKEMASFFRLLDQMEANYHIKGSTVTLKESPLQGAVISFSPYPALATDIQPLLVPLMLDSVSKSKVKDNVYPKRFNYVEGLKSMKANLSLEDDILEITPSKLEGAVVKGYDLRGVFALIIAASKAHGKTTILDGELAFRGYEDMLLKLNKIGIKINQI